MGIRPCLDCKLPTDNGARCPTHTKLRERPGPRQRGYDTQYEMLRKLVLAGRPPCWICGLAGADTADHVLPLSLGGRNTLGNLRPAHARCNYSRGGQMTSGRTQRT